MTRAPCGAKTNSRSLPVAIYHLAVKPVSRSAGRSATAAAAYRAGVEITDERTGEIHDYTRKRGVESADIVLPDGAPEWATDRAALWNAAELAEKRKDACVAREIEVALPAELSPDERRRLALDFAKEMANREGCAVDVAIHAPGKDGDDRNHHAHILRTTRKVAADGLGEKLDTEKAGRKRADDLAAVRARWADLTNERLREAGIEARIDHRSHAARGIEAEPTKHLGPAATGYERRTGQPSENRIRQEEIAERLASAREVGELERQGTALDRSIIDLSGDLVAAKAERDRMQALEARNRAVEASEALARGRYAQALDRVTSETLATLPGLLPPEAVRQALHQVGQEVKADAQQADYQVKAVDLDAIRRQVQAQAAQQRRLEQARSMEGTAQATLESVASMGVLKRMIYDTKAMTAEAQRLQRAAERERAQVEDAVAQSPELREGRRQQAEGEQTLRSASHSLKELGEMQARSERGQALWKQPKHVYRLPETVTRVLEAARAAAPTAVQSMPLPEVQRMAERAAEVAWTPREGNLVEVLKSRFVLPAAEELRRQQLEREVQAQQKGRGR